MGTQQLVDSIVLWTKIVSFIKFICVAAIFYKAGRLFWGRFVPFYSDYVYSQIIFGDSRYFWGRIIALALAVMLAYSLGWSGDLLFTVVGWGLSIWEVVGLSNAFGRGWLFAAGLLFLPFIFYPILVIKETYYG